MKKPRDVNNVAYTADFYGDRPCINTDWSGLTLSQSKRLRDWLDRAIAWMESQREGDDAA